MNKEKNEQKNRRSVNKKKERFDMKEKRKKEISTILLKRKRGKQKYKGDKRAKKANK